MRKLIYSLSLLFVSAFAFGQSVLIEPGTSSKRFVVKSTGANYGHFSTTNSVGADLFFKRSATGDGTTGTEVGIISTFLDRFYIGGTLTNGLSFGANDTEKMRITSTGLVGIGTVSPNYNLHLHNPEVGTSSILQLTNETIGSATTDGLYIGENNFGNASIINQEGGSINISSGGGGITVKDANVGIGNPFVSNTTGKLEVFHNTNNVATTPHINLHTNNNASNGIIRMENSTGSRYFGQYFSVGSATAANNFVSFDYNGSTPILDMQGNGNVKVSGFTTLGNDPAAPKIKMKKFTGNTATTDGGDIEILHGLGNSKIVSINLMVNYSGAAYVKENYTVAGYECNTFLGLGFVNLLQEVIHITNKSGNSSNVLNKPYKLIVTYEE